jgi:hypothetical protein
VGQGTASETRQDPASDDTGLRWDGPIGLISREIVSVSRRLTGAYVS